MSNNKNDNNGFLNRIIIFLVTIFIKILIFILGLTFGGIIILVIVGSGLISMLGGIFGGNKIDNNVTYVNNLIAINAKNNSSYFENFLGLPDNTIIKDKAYIVTDTNNNYYIITRKDLNLALFGYHNSPILTKKQIDGGIEFNKEKLYDHKKIKWQCTKLTDSGNDYSEESCKNKGLIEGMGRYPLLQLFNPFIYNPQNYKVNLETDKLPSFFDIYKNKKSGNKIDYGNFLNIALGAKEAGYIKNGFMMTTNNGFSIEGQVYNGKTNTNGKTFERIFGDYNNVEYLGPLVKYVIGGGYTVKTPDSPKKGLDSKQPKKECEEKYSDLNCVLEKDGQLNMSYKTYYKNHSGYDISSNSDALFNPFLGGGYYLGTYFNGSNTQSYLLSNVGAGLKVYYINKENVKNNKDYIKFQNRIINNMALLVGDLCDNQEKYIKQRIFSYKEVKKICENSKDLFILRLGGGSIKTKFCYINGKIWTGAKKLIKENLKKTYNFIVWIYGGKQLEINSEKSGEDLMLDVANWKLKNFIFKIYLYLKINNLGLEKLQKIDLKKDTNNVQIQSYARLIEEMLKSDNEIKMEYSELVKEANEVYGKIYKEGFDGNLDKNDMRTLEKYFISRLVIGGKDSSNGLKIDITILNITGDLSSNSWLSNYEKKIYIHLILKTLHTQGNYLLDKSIYKNLKKEFVKKIDNFINLEGIDKYLLPLLETKQINKEIIEQKNEFIKTLGKLLGVDKDELGDNIDINKINNIMAEKSNKEKMIIAEKVISGLYQANISISDNNQIKGLIKKYKKNIQNYKLSKAEDNNIAENIKKNDNNGASFGAGSVIKINDINNNLNLIDNQKQKGINKKPFVDLDSGQIIDGENKKEVESNTKNSINIILEMCEIGNNNCKPLDEMVGKLIQFYINEYNKSIKTKENIKNIYEKLGSSVKTLKEKINTIEENKSSILEGTNNISLSLNYPEEKDIKETLLYGSNNSITHTFPFINYGDLYAYKGNVGKSYGPHAHLEIVPFITKSKFVKDSDLDEIKKNLLGKIYSNNSEVIKKIGENSKEIINKLIFHLDNGKCKNNNDISCEGLDEILGNVNNLKEKVDGINKTLSMVGTFSNIINNVSKITGKGKIDALKKLKELSEKYSIKDKNDLNKYYKYIQNTQKISNTLKKKIEELSKNIDLIMLIYNLSNKIFNQNFILAKPNSNINTSSSDKVIKGYQGEIFGDRGKSVVSNYIIILGAGTKAKSKIIIPNNKGYTNTTMPCPININNTKSNINEIKEIFHKSFCNGDYYKHNLLNDIIGSNKFQKISGTVLLRKYLNSGNVFPSLYNGLFKLLAVEYYNKLSRYVNIEPLPLFNLEYPYNVNKSEYVINNYVNNSTYNMYGGIIGSLYTKTRLEKISKQKNGINYDRAKELLYYGNVGFSNKNMLYISDNKYCYKKKKKKPEKCYVGLSARPNTLYNDVNFYGGTNFLVYPQMLTNSPYRQVYYNLGIFQFFYYYLGDLKIRSGKPWADVNKYGLKALLEPFVNLNKKDLVLLTAKDYYNNTFNIGDLKIEQLFSILKNKLELIDEDLTMEEKKRIYENVILKRYYYNLYYLTRLNTVNAYFKNYIGKKIIGSGFILPYNGIINRSDIYIKILEGYKGILGDIYNYFYEKVKSNKDLLIDLLNNNYDIISKFGKVGIKGNQIKDINSKSFNYLYKFIKNNSEKSVFENNNTLWPSQLYELGFYDMSMNEQKKILNKLQGLFSKSDFYKFSLVNGNRGTYLYHDILQKIVYKLYDNTFAIIDLEKNDNNDLYIKNIIKIVIDKKTNTITNIEKYDNTSINNFLSIYDNIPLISYLKIITDKNSQKNIMSVSLLIFDEILNTNIDNLVNVIKENNTNNIGIQRTLDFRNKIKVLNFSDSIDRIKYSLGKYGETLFLDNNVLEEVRYHIRDDFLIPPIVANKIIANGGMKLPDADTSTLDGLIETFKKTKQELKELYNSNFGTNFDFTTDKLLMTLGHFFVESGGRNGGYGGNRMACYTSDNNKFRNISPRNGWYIKKITNKGIDKMYDQSYIRMGAHKISTTECNKELQNIKNGVGTKTIYIYSISYSRSEDTYSATINNFVIKPNKDIILYAFDNKRKDKGKILLEQFDKYLNGLNYYPIVKGFDISKFPVDWNMNGLCFIGMGQMDPGAIFKLKGNWIYKYLVNIKKVLPSEAEKIIRKTSAFTQLVLLEYLWNYNNGYGNVGLPAPKTLLDEDVDNLSKYKPVVNKWLRRYNHSLSYRYNVYNNYDNYKLIISGSRNNIAYSREYKIKILTYIYLNILALKQLKTPDKDINMIEEETSNVIINKGIVEQFKDRISEINNLLNDGVQGDNLSPTSNSGE